jgi:hypothetical protein
MILAKATRFASRSVSEEMEGARQGLPIVALGVID